MILGATGSIGTNTLHILRKHPEYFNLIGIGAYSNFEKLSLIAKEFNVKKIAVYESSAFKRAKQSGLFSASVEIMTGEEGLTELATMPEVDIVLMAIVGTAGLKPSLEAIKLGKRLALASKEILVMAGAVFMKESQKYKAEILPVDSEHSAIFQCLQNNPSRFVDKLYLTASGGAFRNHTLKQMQTVTPEEALRHPNWNMGPKVTTDCATLANKGLELIEAHWLFGIAPEKLQVLIHPSSVIHSLVQFTDGCILAQMAPPFMTFPIQYALSYPDRIEAPQPTIDLTKPLNLELCPPNFKKFPCLRLAIDCLKAGGFSTTIFNAANEVAVNAFLGHKIPFLRIPEIIEETLQMVDLKKELTLESIQAAHLKAITTAEELIPINKKVVGL